MGSAGSSFGWMYVRTRALIAEENRKTPAPRRMNTIPSAITARRRRPVFGRFPRASTLIPTASRQGMVRRRDKGCTSTRPDGPTTGPSDAAAHFCGMEWEDLRRGRLHAAEALVPGEGHLGPPDPPADE